MRKLTWLPALIGTFASSWAQAQAPASIQCNLGGFDLSSKHQTFVQDSWRSLLGSQADALHQVQVGAPFQELEVIYQFQVVDGEIRAVFYDLLGGGKSYELSHSLSKPTSYGAFDTTRFYLLPIQMEQPRNPATGDVRSIALECTTSERDLSQE